MKQNQNKIPVTSNDSNGKIKLINQGYDPNFFTCSLTETL